MPAVLHVRCLDFGRRLEPVGDRVLHGAGQSSEAFRQYFDAIGENKPCLFMTYVGLNEVIPSYFRSLEQELDGYLPYRLIPQIGLMMTGRSDEAHRPKQHYEQRVAQEEYDAQIAAMCVGLQRLQRPVYLRIDSNSMVPIWINSTILERYQRELRDSPFQHDATRSTNLHQL